jgi:hypothetical protein
MKKVLVIALLALSATTFGQTVNGVPLKDINVEYVQIVGTSRGAWGEKTKIDINFGQKLKFFTQKDTELRDENGKEFILNSMVDALNFMSENNYEFVTAYTVTVLNSNVYHFLLRKKNYQREASL